MGQRHGSSSKPNQGRGTLLPAATTGTSMSDAMAEIKKIANHLGTLGKYHIRHSSELTNELRKKASFMRPADDARRQRFEYIAG